MGRQRDEKTGQLEVPWPGELVASAKLDNSFVLVGAWQTVPVAAVVGIVDTIRNRILKFCLELQKQAPDIAKADPADVSQATSNAAGEASRHIFQTIIYGDNYGAVATGGHQSTQTLTVRAGDFSALVKAFVDAGVPQSDAEEVAAAVEEEKGIGPRVGTWLANAGSKVASGAWTLGKGGAWTLGKGVTIAALTKALLAAAGIS